jgi:hypothetical protein
MEEQRKAQEQAKLEAEEAQLEAQLVERQRQCNTQFFYTEFLHGFPTRDSLLEVTTQRLLREFKSYCEHNRG